MSNSALTAALLTGLLLAGGSVYADPTGEQQYYLELLNRARMDPAAELQRMVNLSAPGVWGSPMSDDADVNGSLGLHGTSAAELWAQWSAISAAPAVAWSDALAASAMAYSGLMASMDSQSHTLDGLDLGTRFTNYGYSADYLDLGQNLYAGAASTRHALSAFLIDWGDDDGDAGNGYGTGLQAGATHRNLALDPVMKEFGLGLETLIPVGNVSAVGPQIVSEHYGNTVRLVSGNYVSDAILTGVVFQDSILGDAFYTPGEGLGGLAVQVYDDTLNSLLYTGSTNSAGGFNIPLLGAEGGDRLRVEVPATGLPGSVLTLSSRVLNYGDGSGGSVPVIFQDNAYASFMMVPEPSGVALLAGALGSMLLRRRRLGI